MAHGDRASDAVEVDQQERLEEIRRETMQAAAMPVGALLSFAIAAVSVPFQGRLAGGVVLAALLFIVAGVSILAGRAGGGMAAAMASFSFDFFHVAPIRLLHLRTLAGLALAFVAIALLLGRRPDRHRV